MSSRRKLLTFQELVKSEHDQLERASKAEASLSGAPYTPRQFQGEVELDAESGEPWLVKNPTPRVGLALSGGGIRSATFGLGLLQSLSRQRVLGLVDYMGTVSGGGYLGGFWTAWKQRTGNKEVFPGAEDEPGRETGKSGRAGPGERAEIRHLREFSRFLAPRIGLNEPETWNAVAAVLGGMFPTLLATMAAIVLAVYAWLGLGYLALGNRPALLERLVELNWSIILERPYLVVAGGLVAVFGASLFFSKVRQLLGAERPRSGNWIASYAGVFVVGLMLLGVCWWHAPIRLESYMAVFGLASIGLHVWFERLAWKGNRSERGRHELMWQVAYWIMALATTALGMWVVDLCSGLETASKQPEELGYALGFAPAIGWASAALAVAVVWILVEGIACLAEWFFRLKDPSWDAQGELRLRRAQLQEKLTSSYLKWACVFAAIVLVWNLAFWTEGFLAGQAGTTIGTTKAMGVSIGASGGLTVIFTGLFALVRNWLTKPDKKSVGGSVWEIFKRAFKQWLPMAAATAGALCLIVFTILLMKYYGLQATQRGNFFWAALLIVVIAVKFFDPAYVSLHGFYRARIARAYLGAAFVKGREWERYVEREGKIKGDIETAIKNATGEEKDLLTKLRARANEARRSKPSSRDNRFTSERPVDDLCLTKLEHPDVRPIHLICCAANHLSGDDLPNLYRGARSAVLSQRGITLGDDTVKPSDWDPPLMLSSAQTASAAAFNPQMGEKSFLLGRGGSFLMTALNLRLGLWVMNPVRVRADEDKWILKGRLLETEESLSGLECFWKALKRLIKQRPGQAFYAELIRSSKCLPEDRHANLHLSDGAHFENLGLYELIRRHCTCIIVSDAGQDETVAFDDLGNAIRRVREDFGVEIEISLDPLRPDEQRISGQHAVVGTIYYNGREGNDKGTLIYIKPSLTGDEPADIQQYRTRNKKFPHESTGDQFFSEAQWESYRRLGEHTGDEVFAFLTELTKEERKQAVTVFEKAREKTSMLG
ncbi:hypothetical protein OKA05_28510 [Luteolibacter arcticus]|uniref:PNPLA domain-containing protein n=1 Tax=Luteolibacter arcticus TaxID=1581411 RepID=A0ABT3GSP9_9BACT|nr:hypothetical protein [Luteolibacter arcticus]MCW1926528.1 hypothetical protein [Luteolibacter arcticus]